MPIPEENVVEVADLASGRLNIVPSETRSAVIVETAGKRGVLSWIPPTLQIASFAVDLSKQGIVEVDLAFRPAWLTGEGRSGSSGRGPPAKLVVRPDIGPKDLLVWVFGPGGGEWAIVIPSDYGSRFKVTIEGEAEGAPWKLVTLMFRFGGKGF